MEDRKSHYNKVGMYAGYDKNHKERNALDYYATPTREVTNILNILNIDFNNSVILEPCVGGGHMILGIGDYLRSHNQMPYRFHATDIKYWEKCPGIKDENIIVNSEYTDFLSDKYMYNVDVVAEPIDYIIMNPPYAVIEPFTMKSLGIAQKGVIMLGRIQFLEGEKRFNAILKDYPPTEIYAYVDRISCYKNGDVNEKMASAQMYAWFYWDFTTNEIKDPTLHWIRRWDKQDGISK